MPNLPVYAITNNRKRQLMALRTEVAMSLRARVGRHTQAGGRHCQNWGDDQRTVIDLLNRIPVADGGTDGSLGGRIVAGIASDALYEAISRFEDKYFPGQRSGFLDPGGPMLKRMEELAGPTTANLPVKPRLAPIGPAPAAPEAPIEYRLDILRRSVLDDSPYVLWPAGERAAIAPLITMAVRHIDNLRKGATLRSGGLFTLPWPVELFGRAYIRPANVNEAPHVDEDGTVSFLDLQGGEREEPELPEMSYGHPVDSGSEITTGKLGALLLYDTGYCCRVRAYHHGDIGHLGTMRGRYGARPLPIAGAPENLGIADIDPANTVK